MKRAFRDVDIVIHTASLINSGETLADQQKLKEINIDGTENVINGCIESNVKGLIYTSSREATAGWERNQLNIDESKPYPGEKASDFTGGTYTFTKMEAEKRVIEASGCQLANGERLATCSLSQVGLYGEGTPWFGKRLESARNKKVPTFCTGSSFFQFCYVGNAAWSHVLAAEKMLKEPQVVDGKCYFITDDTPLQSADELSESWMIASGYTFSVILISIRFMYYLVLLFELLQRIVSPFVSFFLLYGSKNFFMMSDNLSFSGENAKRDFNYSLIYSYSYATERTTRFCKDNYAKDR